MSNFIAKKIDFRSSTKSKAVSFLKEEERESKIRSICKILEMKKLTCTVLKTGFDQKIEDFEVLAVFRIPAFDRANQPILQFNKKWINANVIYWNKTFHSKNLFKSFVHSMMEMKEKPDTADYASKNIKILTDVTLEKNLRLLKEFVKQQNSTMRRRETNAIIDPSKRSPRSTKVTPKKSPRQGIMSRLRKRKHRSEQKKQEDKMEGFNYIGIPSQKTKKKAMLLRDSSFAEFFDFDKRVKEIEVSLKLVDSQDTTFHSMIPVEKLADYLKNRILKKIQEERMKVKKNLSFKKSDAIKAIKNIRKDFESFIIKNSTIHGDFGVKKLNL